MSLEIIRGRAMTETPLVIATSSRWKRYAPVPGRIAATLLLLFMTAQAAAAYTLVMRSGRRLEIPDNFFVTRTTLYYEAAPGISVSWQMSMIDIAATERVNHEPAGSLLRRVWVGQSAGSTERSGPAVSPSTPRRARRTITNRDLEDVRRTRARSEEAYERRRIELGLPSLEETRRSNEEQLRRLADAARARDEEEGQAELYWRGRATELRTETAVVDAQINYLHDQLARSQTPLIVSSYATVVTGVAPLFPFGGHGTLPFVTRWPQPLGATDTGARATRVVGPGPTRGQVLVSRPGPFINNLGRRRTFPRPRGFVPPFGLYAQAAPVYDTSYDQSVITTRLRELESVRAGLDARWRLLEDEARRAGAQPGWLRP